MISSEDWMRLNVFRRELAKLQSKKDEPSIDVEAFLKREIHLIEKQLERGFEENYRMYSQ